MNIMNAWLNELILCGYPYPITREQAIAFMVGDGASYQDAVEAVCWFRAATSNNRPAARSEETPAESA